MFGIYLFALIFGFGVILIDMLGLIGSDQGSGDDSGDISADSGDDIDDISADDGIGYNAGDDTGEAGNDSSDLDASDDGVLLPDLRRGRWGYSALNYLRSLVYFALGFGAVGVFGSLTGHSFISTILWSAGAGIVILIIVKFVMRLQRNVLDSQVKAGELMLAQAEVLVTIPRGKLGRIRVKSGGSYHDLYARGKDPGTVYPAGTIVYVVDSSGDDLIVHTAKE